MDLGRVGRTALFNVVRMSSGFALAAILPILVRRLSEDEYNIWTLVVQTPAYVNLLGAGVSVAVVRMVAAAPDEAGTHRVVSAALGFIHRLVVFSSIGVGLAILVFPVVFTSVPADLVADARYGLLAVGCGAAIALIGVPYQSYFNGRQDNGPSSLATLATRVAGAAAVVVVLPMGLAAMFAALGASLVLASLMQRWLYWRRTRSEPRAELGVEQEQELRLELKSFVRTIGIWSIVSVMTAGLDIAVVGALDFSKVGAYGAAASLVMILSGVHTAAMSAFLPDATRAVERDGGRVAMLTAARVGGLIAWMSVAGVAAFGRPVLDLAFGRELASDAMPILVLLMIGRSLNSLVWPYVVFVLAAGQHDRIRTTPIVEGAVNLAVSIVLVASIGAPGAAIGTVIGSLLAMVMHLVVNAPRTNLVSFDRSAWFRASTLMPAAYGAPLFAVAGLDLVVDDVPFALRIAALLVSVAMSGQRLIAIRRTARA